MIHNGMTPVDPDAGVSIGPGVVLSGTEGSDALVKVANRIREEDRGDALVSFLGSLCAGQDDPVDSLQSLFMDTARALALIQKLPTAGNG